MVFGALTPLVVGALGPYLVPDLSLSRSQLGLFVTLSFVVATLASLPSGTLADRVDSRLVVTAIFGVSAAALLALAAASSLAAFLAPALPAGLVQAASNPVTNRAPGSSPGSSSAPRRSVPWWTPPAGIGRAGWPSPPTSPSRPP